MQLSLFARLPGLIASQTRQLQNIARTQPLCADSVHWKCCPHPVPIHQYREMHQSFSPQALATMSWLLVGKIVRFICPLG